MYIGEKIIRKNNKENVLVIHEEPTWISALRNLLLMDLSEDARMVFVRTLVLRFISVLSRSCHWFVLLKWSSDFMCLS